MTKNQVALETTGQWRGMWVVTFRDYPSRNGLRIAYPTEDEAKRVAIGRIQFTSAGAKRQK